MSQFRQGSAAGGWEACCKVAGGQGDLSELEEAVQSAGKALYFRWTSIHWLHTLDSRGPEALFRLAFGQRMSLWKSLPPTLQVSSG